MATAVKTLRAFETTATVDDPQHLSLAEPLPHINSGCVRVIVMVEELEYDDSEIDEAQWVHAVSFWQAPDFADDPAEDIYTMEDGVPFNDKE